MDDLKVSLTTIGAEQKIHDGVKQYAASVGMVNDN